jgi:hypothetical protein
VNDVCGIHSLKRFRAPAHSAGARTLQQQDAICLIFDRPKNFPHSILNELVRSIAKNFRQLKPVTDLAQQSVQIPD